MGFCNVVRAAWSVVVVEEEEEAKKSSSVGKWWWCWEWEWTADAVVSFDLVFLVGLLVEPF